MTAKSVIPTENAINKILIIRNQKVNLDRDLALIYKVETRALKQAVKRNINRFPSDFMFVLFKKEVDLLVSQNVIPSENGNHKLSRPNWRKDLNKKQLGNKTF